MCVRDRFLVPNGSKKEKFSFALVVGKELGMSVSTNLRMPPKPVKERSKSCAPSYTTMVLSNFVWVDFQRNLMKAHSRDD